MRVIYVTGDELFYGPVDLHLAAKCWKLISNG